MKERIRSIMEHVQLSQQDFAARLGISPASLSSIYNGRTNPTNNHVMAVHRAFPNINISWLMFGEGNMISAPQVPEESSDDNLLSVDSGSSLLMDGESVPAEQSRTPSLFDQNPAASVSSPVASSPVSSAARRDLQPSLKPSLQIIGSAINVDKKERKVKEIRVFFDDGTYESFVPSSK